MADLPNQRTAEIDSIYTEDNNTLISRGQTFKTEIGNLGAGQFAPHLKTRRWADTTDECWLSLEFEDTLPGGDSVTYENDVIVWEKSGYQVRIYSVNGFDEGAEFRIDAILPSRPPANHIRFKLEFSGCRFLYQPPLTVDEIAEGRIRGPRVEGSYAVYRLDNKVNNQYETGKICHIFRPHLTDFLGNEIYADIVITPIDANSAWFDVSVDPNWLDNATYPVTVDPDVGYSTAGSSSKGIQDSGMYGHFATILTKDGTVDSLRVHMYNANGSSNTAQMAFYNTSGTRQGVSSSRSDIPDTPADWYDFTMSGEAVTASTTYHVLVGCNFSAGNDFIISYDTDAGTDGKFYASLLPFPSSATISDESDKNSVVLRYTETGGITIKVPQHGT